MDMSLEDSPASPGANARSPSPTPDSPTLDSTGFCRDELYETRQEAAILLDAAEEEEGVVMRSPHMQHPAPGPHLHRHLRLHTHRSEETATFPQPH